jgi:hypothetical protein
MYGSSSTHSMLSDVMPCPFSGVFQRRWQADGVQRPPAVSDGIDSSCCPPHTCNHSQLLLERIDGMISPQALERQCRDDPTLAEQKQAGAASDIAGQNMPSTSFSSGSSTTILLMRRPHHPRIHGPCSGGKRLEQTRIEPCTKQRPYFFQHLGNRPDAPAATAQHEIKGIRCRDDTGTERNILPLEPVGKSLSLYHSWWFRIHRRSVSCPRSLTDPTAPEPMHGILCVHPETYPSYPSEMTFRVS